MLQKWEVRVGDCRPPATTLVWEMAVMSSIGYFRTLSPSSSLLVRQTATRLETFDAEPRRGIFHRDWCQHGHLRLVKTQMGRYSDWHIALQSRVRSSSEGRRQIHQDGPHAETTGVCCQPPANLHYRGDLTVPLLPPTVRCIRKPVNRQNMCKLRPHIPSMMLI